jgi:hypothetical protein
MPQTVVQSRVFNQSYVPEVLNEQQQGILDLNKQRLTDAKTRNDEAEKAANDWYASQGLKTPGDIQAAELAGELPPLPDDIRIELNSSRDGVRHYTEIVERLSPEMVMQPSTYQQMLGEYDTSLVAPQLQGSAPYIDYEQQFLGAEAPEVMFGEAAVVAEAPVVDAAQLDMAGIDPYLALAEQARGTQVEALGLQRQAAMGMAPSAAAIQMQIGLDEATQRQMALANAARGGAGAAMRAQRMAAQQGAAMQQAGIRESAMLRAQEMATARGAFGEGARALAMTDRDMTELAQIRAAENAGNVQAARELTARFMQERNMTNAEFAQQMETFNVGAQNYANVIGQQFVQEAGVAGEEIRGRQATRQAELEQEREFANLDSKLKTAGLDVNRRAQLLSQILGVQEQEARRQMQFTDQVIALYSGERERGLREWQHQTALEASEPEWWETALEVGSDLGGAAVDFFTGGAKSAAEGISRTLGGGGSGTTRPPTTAEEEAWGTPGHTMG